MSFVATDSERAHLRRALELADRGRGRVSPNPTVGAVLVADGEVIGEGFHAELGGVHAEVAAIADARERGAADRLAGASHVRQPRAVRPPGAPAAVHPADPRGGDRPRRDRLRRPEPEGVGPRPGHPARRGRRGRVRRRRRGRRRAAGDPAVSQARPHRPAAGDAQVRGQPRRLHGHDRGRLALDLRAREPRPGAPLARRGGRRRGRHRDRARGRSAAHSARRRRTRRRSTSPRASCSTRTPACRSTRRSCGRSISRRSTSSRRSAPTRAGWRRCARGGAEVMEIAGDREHRLRAALARARAPGRHLAAGGGRLAARGLAARRRGGRPAAGVRRPGGARRRHPAGGRTRAGAGGRGDAAARRSSGRRRGEDMLASARLREW